MVFHNICLSLSPHYHPGPASKFRDTAPETSALDAGVVNNACRESFRLFLRNLITKDMLCLPFYRHDLRWCTKDMVREMEDARMITA